MTTGENELSRPEVDAPEGPAPTELVVEDITVGDGPEATPGATVNVHYLGVEYETGEEFDASWNRGQSINFPLRSLIAGWQQAMWVGVACMAVLIVFVLARGPEDAAAVAD